MQKLTLLLTLLFPFILSAQSPTQHICKDADHLAEMEAQYQAHKLSYRANPLTQDYDLKYHRLEWEVDPAVSYIKGRVTSYFVPGQSDFQHVHFDLAANMTVNEVLWHGQALSFSLSGNDVLQIQLPQPLPEGVLDSVTVDYQGAPQSVGFGSFELDTHNGVPVLWTLSEPYGAKVWWPCKQDLNDKIDSIDVWVTTPAEYRVATNGVLKGEYPEGDFMRYHWKHRYPIPAYLIAIAVTNYTDFSDYVELENGDSLEILNYVYPESQSYAEQQFGNTVEMMELFNELFGEYPFAEEKYGHAQFSWGGGMEHQTMSFMGGASYSLQAHELAHQWFGNKVTCGSWEDIWLNEGFATYLTGLTNEFLKSPAQWYNWKAGAINYVASQPDGSVWVPDTTSVGRIFSGRLSYNKGALLLHMLRWKLGDEDFFQGVRNYLADPALAFSYARTEDLQTHLEAQSGQELDEFFHDWFYGQGYPSYQLGWHNGNDGLHIKIEQTTSHPSVDFYEMPVPVRVSGQGQDSILRLENTLNNQDFFIPLPFEVESLTFDPDLWLLSADNSVETIVVNTQDLDPEQDPLRVFPNPFTNQLSVQLHQAVERLELYDLYGRMVYTSGPRQGLSQINTSHLPSGAYILVVHGDDGKQEKLVLKN